MRWQEEWTERFYRSRPGWQDGTTMFHESFCRPHVPAAARILEVGAGPTNPTSAFLSKLGELHGVDIGDEARGNAYLKTASIIENDRYPFPDASFDIAVSNYVVEHVAQPAAHLREIHRVLKPGGHYVFRTPNLWHYVALASKFTRHDVHVLTANWLRALPKDQHDPWPTVYAMNTAEAVRREAQNAHFEVARIDLVEREPSYGMVARPLFLAFMAYERIVNATSKLAGLRANLFVVLRKPAVAEGRRISD